MREAEGTGSRRCASKGRTAYPAGHCRPMRMRGVIGRRLLVVAAALVLAARPRRARGRPDAARPARPGADDRGGLSSPDGRARARPPVRPVVYRWHRDRSLRPASNEKLASRSPPSTGSGPDYRIRTEVLGAGSRAGSTWQGRLVLRGYGDPTLTTGDLRTLASKLRAAGIRRVTGRVLGDESLLRHAPHGGRLARRPTTRTSRRRSPRSSSTGPR